MKLRAKLKKLKKFIPREIREVAKQAGAMAASYYGGPAGEAMASRMLYGSGPKASGAPPVQGLPGDGSIPVMGNVVSGQVPGPSGAYYPPSFGGERYQAGPPDTALAPPASGGMFGSLPEWAPIAIGLALVFVIIIVFRK